MLRIKRGIQKQIPADIGDFGYKDKEEFIEDALRRRLLDLKKTSFFIKAQEIKERMGKKGIKSKAVLKDFDKFYHKA